jgi:hypothetical protein
MKVDSFKFLPRAIAKYYQRTKQVPELPIPWTPLKKNIDECKFGLVTSGGFFTKSSDIPFNVEKEKENPTWGDPTFRKIPVKSVQEEIGASHLHINTRDILLDVNILLPINRFLELKDLGVIGDLSENAFSFMGYQGFPPNVDQWRNEYGPQVAEEFISDDVDCVFLTPA